MCMYSFHMNPYVDQYEKKHLVANNYSMRTRDVYLRNIREFVAFIGTSKVTPKTVQAFRDRVTSQKVSAPTKNLKMTSVRSFLQFLGTEGSLDFYSVRNVLFAFKDRAGKKDSLDLPKNDDILAFLKTIAGDIPSKSKLYVLARIILSTGLRLSEAMSLQIGQFAKQTVVIGKGAKQRMVIADDEVVKLVRAYEKTLDPKQTRLFDTANRIVQSHLSIASAGKITAHTLRHVYATNCVTAGASLSALQGLLGHSSITTTQRYLHVSNDYLVKEMASVDSKIQRYA